MKELILFLIVIAIISAITTESFLRWIKRKDQKVNHKNNL